MSRVSVIMPVYLGAEFVAQAIESALAQTHRDLELIVVNDGSPDHSGQAIQPYLRDARVTYLEQANAGVANARNAGIRQATGEFLAFLDQDDLWDGEKLARQVAFMNAHPEVALVHGDIGFIDVAGQPLARPDWAWVRETSGDCAANLVRANRIATMTALLRRSCLEGMDLFRQELAPADDWDLWLRLAVRHPFGFIAEPLGRYRLHAGNESRRFLKMKIAEAGVIEHFIREQRGAEAVRSGAARRKLLALYKQTARVAARERQHAVARAYWLKALAMQPWAPETYAGLIRDALGRNAGRLLGRYCGARSRKDKRVS